MQPFLIDQGAVQLTGAPTRAAAHIDSSLLNFNHLTIASFGLNVHAVYGRAGKRVSSNSYLCFQGGMSNSVLYRFSLQKKKRLVIKF